MFQTNTPVAGARFFNRKQELDLLGKAIARLSTGTPQWLAILGPRRIGKTSLVLEAARRAGPAAARVVVLDVQQQDAGLQIFRRLVLRVLDAVFGVELGESLERLIRQPALYRRALQRSEAFARLPAGLRAELLEVPGGAAVPERLHEWLDLPEQVAQGLGLKLVIALDQFQELQGLARKQPSLFGQMRAIWQRHRNVAYIISGSARSMLLALISHETSPFFHHFAIVDVGPFSQDAAIELLQRAGGEDPPIPKDVAAKCVDIIGGHPFYLQLLGETLTQEHHAPTEADLKDALQSLLFSPYGRLALFFENEMQRLAGRSTFLAATLDALAGGPATLTEVAARIRTSTGATAGYLGRLKDAISRTADARYELADPAFGLWLRWKRPGEGTLVPISVIGDETEKAVARLLAAMGFDLMYQSRASRGAFDLLATRDSAQLGVQATRSCLPLRFTQGQWSRLEAQARRLHWHWVLAAQGADGSIHMLDPARATKGREVRVGAAASIENVLLWLDNKKNE